MPTFCRKPQVASFHSSLKQPYTKSTIMLTRFSERIFEIGNIRLLGEANAYIFPQVTSSYSSLNNRTQNCATDKHTIGIIYPVVCN